jgi:hypothetical protein
MNLLLGSLPMNGVGRAPPEAIYEHARLAGLPVDAVHQVGSVIDPSTGD